MKEVKMFSVSVYVKDEDGLYTARENALVKADTPEEAMVSVLAKCPFETLVACGTGEPWEWTAYEGEK